MKKTSNILKAAIVLVLVAGFGLGQKSQAQQISHYTQTLLNPYIYNPAVAGTNNYFQMRIANRLQWIGINDAPVTFNVSCYGPFAKRDMGWGAYITSDNTGRTASASVRPFNATGTASIDSFLRTLATASSHQYDTR